MNAATVTGFRLQIKREVSLRRWQTCNLLGTVNLHCYINLRYEGLCLRTAAVGSNLVG
jgi:hypothetical protein